MASVPLKMSIEMLFPPVVERASGVNFKGRNDTRIERFFVMVWQFGKGFDPASSSCMCGKRMKASALSFHQR